MNGKQITFDDIHARQYVDIIGGHVEVTGLNTVTHRGVIRFMEWWNDGYPKSITWGEGLMMGPDDFIWVMNPGGTFTFQREHIRNWTNPFELHRGMIFFTFYGVRNVTLYPIGCPVPPTEVSINMLREFH